MGAAKLKAEWGGAPSAAEVSARDEERMLADPAWSEPVSEGEQDAVEMLMSGFSTEQIAAAYLRLYRAQHSAPEELGEVDAKPAPRPEFGPSVWFAVSGGRAADAEPRRLLPMLCKAGDLTKDDIGAIRVQQDQSFVQIREASVAGFLAAVGPDMVLEEGAELTQLKDAPVLEKGGKPPRKGGGKPKGKSWDKPQGRGAKPTKPKREFSKEEAKSDPKPKKSTPPVEWNDAPEPRAKKPKPASKGGPKAEERKPRHKSKPGKGSKPRRDEAEHGKARARGGDAKPTRATSGKPKNAADPSKRVKGPPPPKGKPNSKKNRARAAAAAKAKRDAAGKSGRGKR